MKRFLNLIAFAVIFMTITLSAMAEENRVDVRKNDSIFNIYAEAYGNGYSLESAKSAAISNIMPQLIEKTEDLPGSIRQSMTTNGIKTGEGACNIAARTFVQSYWKLENGVYHYTIKLFVDNTTENKLTEDAEKP